MLQFESLGLVDAEKAIAAGTAAARSLGKAMAFAIADHNRGDDRHRAHGRRQSAHSQAFDPQGLHPALMCRHTLSANAILRSATADWINGAIAISPRFRRSGGASAANMSARWDAGGGGPGRRGDRARDGESDGIEVMEDGRATKKSKPARMIYFSSLGDTTPR